MLGQLAFSFYFKNCKYNGKPANLDSPIPSWDSSIAFFFLKRLQFLLDPLLAACTSPTDSVISSPKSGRFLRIRFCAGPALRLLATAAPTWSYGGHGLRNERVRTQQGKAVKNDTHPGCASLVLVLLCAPWTQPWSGRNLARIPL